MSALDDLRSRLFDTDDCIRWERSLAGNGYGMVLDPFAGSGTTLAVADLHGRDAIGVDFDERNKAIYPRRYDEVRRALFGSPIPDANQMELAL